MKLVFARIDWFVVVVALACAVGCSGGGCGGCTTFSPIPGGFNPAKRAPNAVQARVSSSGLAFITNPTNTAKILGAFAGGAQAGVIKFSPPASCGGNPQICCSNGQPVANCGPLDVDLNQHAGDPAPLALAPQSGQSKLHVTISTRMKTEMPIPITYSGTNCTISFDTSGGSPPYATIATDITFTQDATTVGGVAEDTTRISAANTSFSMDTSTINIGGDFLCSVAGFFINTGWVDSFLNGQIASQIQNAINGATCKKCASGDVAECGNAYATACTKNVCQEGPSGSQQCLQELGIDGRAKSASLFGALSPGTGGGIDIYEVAGGYATTDNNGIALGLLGGMEPAAQPRDLCGPASAEPALPTITKSTYFEGNTRPDNNAAFDVGIGIHASQLTQFAYAGYDGGLLCLTMGHSKVKQLDTDTIGLLSRSLTHLVTSNSPMAVGIRPQSPPTIALGANTFVPDGNGGMMLQTPLLDIHFKALEIDFFAEVDQQWIRAFTVVSDVHLPVGLQTATAGEITPVIGNPMDAFTNISVKNSEPLTETPDQLASVFPSILGIVLPQLSNGLAPIKLPAVGGLQLNVTSITSVDSDQYLALFANFGLAVPLRPLHTTATVLDLWEPDHAVWQDARQWSSSSPPRVTLQLGVSESGGGDLEYSYKLDGGAWSAWSKSSRVTLAPVTFWLPGVHKVEVRARAVDQPETTDLAPVEIVLPIGVAPPAAAKDEKKLGAEPFHGSGGPATGCGCDTRGGDRSGALVVLVIAMVILPLRRIRRGIARLGKVAWLAALACAPACDCNHKPCGSAKCLPGEVQHAPGKWTSIAGDDKRVMVATYDVVNGDLVVVDATNPSKLAFKVVDGMPTGATPTYDPSTYRGGLTDPGPDVGAWTSIALAKHTARIAYQDRDNFALKYAYEDDNHHWHPYTVDPGNGLQVGEYADLAIDGSGHPAIAYLSLGNPDGMGHYDTLLQLARASLTDPTSAKDWTISTIASAHGTCAGYCPGGQACVAGTPAGSPEVCAAVSGGCNPGCGSAQTCINNACVTAINAEMIDDIPTGTGLWADLVVLPDGRLAATYYDRSKRALVIAVESSAGSSMFTETILDGNTAGADRGMWASSVVAVDGTVHIAYQDALGDQLMYTTWNGSPGTPEVVDDGERPGDRTHPVGAGNAIYITGGVPTIAYQDAMNADVWIAQRGTSSWSTTDFAAGPILDGFSIGATTAHNDAAVLAWDARDPSLEANGPPNTLVIQAP